MQIMRDFLVFHKGPFPCFMIGPNTPVFDIVVFYIYAEVF